MMLCIGRIEGALARKWWAVELNDAEADVVLSAVECASPPTEASGVRE